ncbi:MAG: hypothetical protein N4A47_07085 [Clostridia bacterium]|jgi:uncharacterized HAD superfamily protein|nr:hypothetical protein [Clostridia bacterium]
MRIGIDIDNTITDTYKTFLEYCYIYDNTLRGNGIINDHQHNVQYKFDWTNDEMKNFNDKCVDEININAKIFRDAKEVINRLYDEGHEIYFITARNKKISPKAEKITFNWLKENNIKFHNLIINAEVKLRECIDNDIDIMIDDSYKIYKKLNDNNIRCILLENALNRDILNREKDLFFEDWNGIYKYINIVECK